MQVNFPPYQPDFMQLFVVKNTKRNHAIATLTNCTQIEVLGVAGIGSLHKINDRLERILKIFSSGSDFYPLFRLFGRKREGLSKSKPFSKRELLFFLDRRKERRCRGAGWGLMWRHEFHRTRVKHHY